MENHGLNPAVFQVHQDLVAPHGTGTPNESKILGLNELEFIFGIANNLPFRM